MGVKVFPPWRDGPPPPGLYRAEEVIANRYPLHVYVDGEGKSWYCLREVFKGYEKTTLSGLTSRIVLKVPNAGNGSPLRTFVTQEALTELAERTPPGEVKSQREWVALFLETGGFAGREGELVAEVPEVRAPGRMKGF